jgi:hypothetical protein
LEGEGTVGKLSLSQLSSPSITVAAPAAAQPGRPEAVAGGRALSPSPLLLEPYAPVVVLEQPVDVGL